MTSPLVCFVFCLFIICVLAQLHPGEEFVTKDDLQVLISRIQSQETKMQLLETKTQSQETKTQSQETKIQLLETKIQLLETKLHSQETKIQSQEAQLKTKQDRTPLISFKAGFVHDPVPLKFSNGQVVMFDKVYLNDGNAYIAHSGMFHAPVSGLYIFTLHVLTSSSEMEFQIIKNGVQVAYMVSTSSGGTESMQTVMHVHRGQEVWIVKHWGGDTLRGHDMTTFSGFLLRTDGNNILLNGGSLVVG